MALRNRIKELRTERGESLTDVADAVGMDRAQLHRVEREIRGCSYEKMLALARHFDLTITDLFFEDGVGEVSTEEVPA